MSARRGTTTSRRRSRQTRSTHGRNQTSVAIGDGAEAGIAVHHDLRRFPPSTAEYEERDAEDLRAPAAADDLRARMRHHRTLDGYAGMTPPDGS